MANPRKFSDKIALIAQKQAEGTAAFEAILREVSVTTRQVPKDAVQTSNQLLVAQPSFATCRGRSLPNVNQIASSCGSIDLQSALSSLENMRQSVNGQTTLDKTSRSRTNQGQKKFSFNHHRDSSPYGSVLLSPPESGWRRATSDSALHASVVACPESNLSASNSAYLIGQDTKAIPMDTGQPWLSSKDRRPKSSEVPGISIFQSPDHGASAGQVALSNNSGSLPDLANLNFPSPPYVTPLDSDVGPCSMQQQQRVTQNVLPCYVAPGDATSVQQNSRAIPTVRLGQMDFVSPLFLQDSNNFIVTGAGSNLLSQGNRLALFSHAAMPQDLPTPPPPPYPSSSSALSVRSPPPMITLTDDAMNGSGERILFADVSSAPLNFFPTGGDSSYSGPVEKWPTPVAQSVSVMNSSKFSAPSSSRPSSADLPTGSLSSDQDTGRFSQGAVVNREELSSFSSSKVLNSKVATNAKSASLATVVNGAKGTAVGPPLVQILAGASSSDCCRMISTLPVSQCQLTSVSVPIPSGLPTSVTSSGCSQHLPRIVYEPGLVVGGGSSVLHNGSQPVVNQLLINMTLPSGFTQSGPLPANSVVSVIQQPLHQQISSSGGVVFVQPNATGSAPSTVAGLSNDPSHLTSLSTPWIQSDGSQFSRSTMSQQPPSSQYATTSEQVSTAADISDDIMLTSDDLLLLPMLATDSSATGVASDGLPKANLINTSAYLGDSFEADLLAADEFLTLGLDPLELDEIQMLSETAIFTDAATEDSFRLDRI